MKKYVEVEYREYRPYVELFSISHYALERAANAELGRMFVCFISIVFDAFCLEAYLNHLGLKKIPENEFAKYEKKTPKEKLTYISNIINYPIKKMDFPFSHFDVIFDFRDGIVHAKTDRVGPIKVRLNEKTNLPEIPKTKTERTATLENARKFYKSTNNMINNLNIAAGFSNDAFFSPYDAFWSNTILL